MFSYHRPDGTYADDENKTRDLAYAQEAHELPCNTTDSDLPDNPELNHPDVGAMSHASAGFPMFHPKSVGAMGHAGAGLPTMRAAEFFCGPDFPLHQQQFFVPQPHAAASWVQHGPMSQQCFEPAGQQYFGPATQQCFEPAGQQYFGPATQQYIVPTGQQYFGPTTQQYIGHAGQQPIGPAPQQHSVTTLQQKNYELVQQQHPHKCVPCGTVPLMQPNYGLVQQQHHHNCAFNGTVPMTQCAPNATIASAAQIAAATEAAATAEIAAATVAAAPTKSVASTVATAEIAAATVAAATTKITAATTAAVPIKDAAATVAAAPAKIAAATVAAATVKDAATTVAAAPAKRQPKGLKSLKRLLATEATAALRQRAAATVAVATTEMAATTKVAAPKAQTKVHHKHKNGVGPKPRHNSYREKQNKSKPPKEWSPNNGEVKANMAKHQCPGDCCNPHKPMQPRYVMATVKPGFMRLLSARVLITARTLAPRIRNDGPPDVSACLLWALKGISPPGIWFLATKLMNKLAHAMNGNTSKSLVKRIHLDGAPLLVGERIKLEDFLLWTIDLKAYCEMQGLTKYIIGPEPTTPTDADDLKEHKNNLAEGLRYLCGTCQDANLKATIALNANGKGTDGYKYLVDEFLQGQPVQSRYLAMLQSMSLKKSDSVVLFRNKWQKVVSQLAPKPDDEILCEWFSHAVTTNTGSYYDTCLDQDIPRSNYNIYTQKLTQLCQKRQDRLEKKAGNEGDGVAGGDFEAMKTFITYEVQQQLEKQPGRQPMAPEDGANDKEHCPHRKKEHEVKKKYCTFRYPDGEVCGKDHDERVCWGKHPELCGFPRVKEAILRRLGKSANQASIEIVKGPWPPDDDDDDDEDGAWSFADCVEVIDPDNELNMSMGLNGTVSMVDYPKLSDATEGIVDLTCLPSGPDNKMIVDTGANNHIVVDSRCVPHPELHRPSKIRIKTGNSVSCITSIGPVSFNVKTAEGALYTITRRALYANEEETGFKLSLWSVSLEFDVHGTITSFDYPANTIILADGITIPFEKDERRRYVLRYSPIEKETSGTDRDGTTTTALKLNVPPPDPLLQLLHHRLGHCSTKRKLITEKDSRLPISNLRQHKAVASAAIAGVGEVTAPVAGVMTRVGPTGWTAYAKQKLVYSSSAPPYFPPVEVEDNINSQFRPDVHHLFGRTINNGGDYGDITNDHTDNGGEYSENEYHTSTTGQIADIFKKPLPTTVFHELRAHLTAPVA